MHIICLRKQLYSALQQAVNIVDIAGKVQPKYSTVLISAHGGSVVLYGTGLTAHLSVQFDGNILEEGDLCITLNRLLRAIGSLTSESVSLHLKDLKLQLDSDDGVSIMLETINPEYFSKGIARVGNTPCTCMFTINSEQLCASLTKCLPFCDTTQNNAISGVNLQSEGVNVRVTGCSSIAAISTLIKGVLQGDVSFDFTLPLKGVACISSIFNEDVKIEVSETYVYLYNDNAELYLSLITGKYPPIMSIIPKDTKQQLPINRQKFCETFDLTDIVSINTLLSVVYEGQQCTLSYGKEVSAVLPITETVPLTKFKFDYTLFRKAFKAEPREDYILQYNAPTIPAVIHVDDTVFMLGLAIDM